MVPQNFGTRRGENMENLELLWLWFDYHTEKFDQQFPNQPSPFDDGSCVLIYPEHKHYSSQNARALQDHILSISRHYGFSDEDFWKEKNNFNKRKKSTRENMKEYEWLSEHRPYKFAFIDAYNKEQVEKQEYQLQLLKKQLEEQPQRLYWDGK